jgi:dockerin type I repeat protein
VLIGDTNGNGAVNSTDASQTKSRIGQVLDGTNFKSDVNANGSINSTDATQVKSNIGTGLP